MAKVLVVDDEPEMAATVRDVLEAEGHGMEVVHSGEQAIEYLTSWVFDLVILDWGLPKVSGIEVLKRFRARGGDTPVLILTGKSEIDEKETGLNAGADDYLTKPFHVRELKARINALLRRQPEIVREKLQIRDIELDRSTRTVKRSGEEILLQPLEFAVFEFLVRHKNQVFSPDVLIQRIWDSNEAASTEAIYTCIKKLRKKLDIEGQPSIIRTLYGNGYQAVE